MGHCAGNPNTVAQKAAVAALAVPQDSVNEMCRAFQRRRNYMVKRMNRIEGVSCLVPHGAFYVFMNMEQIIGRKLFGSVIRNADDFASPLLKHGKVAVVPGSGFGVPNYVRWSYATSKDNIEKGLDRLEKFLKGEAV